MLRFYCPCGKRLKVDDSLAGKVVECPQCHTKLEVPAADGAAEADAGQVQQAAGQQAETVDPGLADLLSAVKGGSAPRPAAGGARQPATANGRKAAGPRRAGAPSAMSAGRRQPGQQNSNKMMMIGILGSVGLIVVIGLTMYLVSLSQTPPPQPAKQETGKLIDRPTVKFNDSHKGEMFPQTKFVDPTKPSASEATATPAATSAAPATPVAAAPAPAAPAAPTAP